jgi:Domain of unknown function (DUF4062)/inactive STAND
MWRVFLSSTFRDLVDYRRALCDAIESLDGYYCVRMETFGARAWDAVDFCQSKVRECQLFIGVLGHLYGSCPPGSEKSYTELEYEAASAIPRLMFVAPDDFDLPVNLREPDARWQQQRAFRARASQEQIRAVFNSPQQLALEVIKAIRNWEWEQPPPGEGGTPLVPPWEKRYRSQDRGPHLGSLVNKLCDRGPQEDEFFNFFSFHIRQHPGFPQIYLVHGDESERPDSLVERFVNTSIQDYANYKWGDQKAAIADESVDWPYREELAQRQRGLLSRLFRKFDPTYEFNHDDFSPAAFTRLPGLKLNPMIILQHEIRAAEWNQTAKSLLEWYLQFWDATGRLAPKPQFLIFFNVLYPPRIDERSWRAWLKLSRFERKRIETQLIGICQLRQDALNLEGQDKACPCLLLKELSCIEREQVMDWFRRHKIYDDWRVWQSKCNEIFKGRDCRTMGDIEYELKLIHQEFIAKRGHL